MTNSLYKFEDIVINYCERVQPQPGDEKYYVGLEHLTSGTFSVDTSGSETELDGQKIKMKKGDVLFARRRAYQKKVGIAPFDGIFSAHGMIIRPKDDVIIQDFLPFFISSDYFLNRAIKLSVGSLSPTLNWGTIKTEMFSIPDKKSQEQYSALLWKLEEYKVLCQNNIIILEQLIKSRFIELFGDQDRNEKGFTESTIGESCIIRDSERIPITSTDREEGPYPYYGANGLQDHVKDFIFDGEFVLVAEDGGYFDDPTRPNSYYVSGKCWVNNHAHILQPKSELNVHYLDWAIKYRDLTSAVNGTTRAKLTQAAMRAIKILVPPINIQNDFASFLEQVDKSRLSLQQHLEDTKQLQRSIINSIFGDAE